MDNRLEYVAVVNDTRCTIEDCERATVARGWCGRHYQRWRTYGDPLFTKLPMKVDGTLEERFWAKVDAMGVCWEWQAATDRGGYGVFNPHGTIVRTHRFAWEMLVGPIPEGLHIDHLCRNRICCNPDHLEPVTPGENARRGYATVYQKIWADKITHCPRNHEYTDENTHINKRNGTRKCRKCHRDRERERREARRKDEG